MDKVGCIGLGSMGRGRRADRVRRLPPTPWDGDAQARAAAVTLALNVAMLRRSGNRWSLGWPAAAAARPRCRPLRLAAAGRPAPGPVATGPLRQGV